MTNNQTLTVELKEGKVTNTSLYKVDKNGITGRLYNVSFPNDHGATGVFATNEAEAISEAKQMLENFWEYTTLEEKIEALRESLQG